MDYNSKSAWFIRFIGQGHCQGDVTFYINTKAQGARIAATGCLPQPLPASLLPFFQNLVCDSKSEWNRSDYLAAIQTAVTTNAVLSTYAPNFSAVSQSSFTAALQANNCQAAVQELVKAFSQSDGVSLYWFIIASVLQNWVLKTPSNRCKGTFLLNLCTNSNKSSLFPTGSRS